MQNCTTQWLSTLQFFAEQQFQSTLLDHIIVSALRSVTTFWKCYIDIFIPDDVLSKSCRTLVICVSYLSFLPLSFLADPPLLMHLLFSFHNDDTVCRLQLRLGLKTCRNQRINRIFHSSVASRLVSGICRDEKPFFFLLFLHGFCTLVSISHSDKTWRLTWLADWLSHESSDCQWLGIESHPCTKRKPWCLHMRILSRLASPIQTR
jgi:hypothetical protein